MMKALATAGIALATVLAANAGTLSTTLTADNTFKFYLSTDDASLGTLVGSGDNWQQGYSFNNIALNDGQDYYLHIVGHNEGALGSGSNSSNPGAILGQFSLAGTGHTFANGGDTLLTNTANWNVSESGFGSGMTGATSFGTNGGSNIWSNVHGGAISGISNQAQWIWSSAYSNGQDLYATSKISATPEPATMMIMASGLVGLARRRSRK